MPKVTGGESNLLMGVSQQPDDRRVRGTLKSQLNMYTHVLRGVQRRPSTLFYPLAYPVITASESYYEHFELDGEDFLLRVTYDLNIPSTLYVSIVDILGVETQVTIDPTVLPYITSVPADKLQITATTDGIYILNTTMVTRMTSETTLPPYGAYVELTGTNYGRKYEIHIDGASQAGVEIPIDTTGLDYTDLQSESVMAKLDTAFVNTSYTTSVSGSTMFIAPTDIYSYMNLETYDGDNNNYLKIAQRVISDVKQLPKDAIKDTILTVRPNNGGKESEYYLKYTDKQELYDNETGVTPPPPADVTFSYNYLTTTKQFDISGKSCRGYSTVLGNSGGSISPTAFLGGTVTDLFVETTSTDQDNVFYDQAVTLRHTGTTETLPSKLELEINGKLYILNHIDGSTYQTINALDVFEHDPYRYLKEQGNNGAINILIRNSIVADFANMFPGGIWIEAVQPGLTFDINKSTMPLKITRDMDANTWDMSTVDWEKRRVGNDENNAEPSFIGQTINSMAFIQSRLVFLTNDSVVFSRVDREIDFWKRSATTLTDDDRIDIEARLVDTGAFSTLTAHDKDIVIFGEHEQWVIPTVNGLSPKTAFLRLTSRYDCDEVIRPVTLGATLAYPVFDGVYSQVREFYTRDDTNSNDSEYLTAIVPQYIKGAITNMISSTLFNLMLVQTDEPDIVHVMQWHNQNGQRVMQAWHTWELPFTPEHMFFAGSSLVLIINDGTYMRRVDVALNDTTVGNLTHNLHLDLFSSYTIGASNTITLPDNHLYTNDSIVVGGNGSNYPGMKIGFTITGNTLTVNDGLGTVLFGEWCIGNKFNSKLRLPTVVYRDEQDRYDDSGTLRLNSVTTRHEESGPYSVSITRSWGDYFNEAFVDVLDMSRLVGAAQLDAPLIATGDLRVPVRERSEFTRIDIETDSHLPLTITGYDWQGQLSGSGQRRYF